VTQLLGYNTLGYFARIPYVCPTKSADAIREFKTIVHGSHAGRLEVILDVVYNHTAEGGHLGHAVLPRHRQHPYYRLEPGQPSRYQDFTGCGNTLNMQARRCCSAHGQPALLGRGNARRRFPIRSRVRAGAELHSVDRLSSFFDLIQQDPVVSRVKLHRGPWMWRRRLPGGNFPPGWAEVERL
jgi:glycogen operon protein